VIHSKTFAVATIAMLLVAANASAQTFLSSGIKFVDKASGNSQDWKVSTSAAGDQGFNFPASPGVAGQVLKVISVNGNDATFGWSSGGASVAETSTRLAADAFDSTSWSTGPQITVECGKKYRIAGEFAVARGTSGSSDAFLLRINVPDGTYAEYSVECLDCPANTTGVPQFTSGTGTGGTANVALATAINPDGSMEGVTYNYRIEGFISVACAGSTGNVRLTFNKSGGAPITSMKANSYWSLIEIQ
jgi:hypothetical protein